MSNKLIDLVNISKSYDGQLVLDELNLYIRENEFLTLLGPSGCGKTTTLRIIGGFETPNSGKVIFNGEDITHLPPNKRQINTVFQKYALFTHMSIAENIAFGLKIKGKSKQYISDKIKYALKLVNLDGFENRSPASLSGGQQQRIAIARAIVNEPKVLLLDEPLGALDLKLRQDMQYELIRLKNELGITFIYVTHDQLESMAMADHIVLMNQGKIMQQATPEVIYNDPDNIFTAQFIGTPATNILPIERREVSLGYRPEKVRILRERDESAEYLREGKIVTREMLGSETIYHVQIKEGRIVVKSLDFDFHNGDSVWIAVDRKHMYFFDNEGNRIRENLSDLVSSVHE